MADKGIPGWANGEFKGKNPPPADFITWFLGGADVTSPTSPLHRNGTRPEDASPGNHIHDGRTSGFLFSPTSDIITGDLLTNTGQRDAIKKIIQLLVRLGAVDSTTN
jgi:hypothetical protein